MNDESDYLAIPWKTKDRFLIEAEMVKRGGYFTYKNVKYGHGPFYHMKAAMTALWPHFDWHDWSNLLIQTFSENKEIGVMGPGSSGKTYTSGGYGLCKFYIWPQNTSIIMSSTTREAACSCFLSSLPIIRARTGPCAGNVSAIISDWNLTVASVSIG